MDKDLLKELVRSLAKEIAEEYELESEYNTDFLAEMIRRYYWHPEEGMKKIARRTMQKMKEINKKGKKLVETSAEKNLQKLEEELCNSPRVTDEQNRGFLVKNVVGDAADEIKEKLRSLAVAQ